jgi:hypothetical protein
MQLTEHLEIKNGICEFRPRGESTLVEVVTLIASVIANCRERNIGKLLVDTTGLRGVPMPTLVDRFLLAEEWAAAAGGRVIAALIIHPEFIHPKKFGVQVAADLGLEINVFPSEDEAFVWLSNARDPSALDPEAG